MQALRPLLAAILICLLLGAGPPTARAANNMALGGIGGLNNGTLIGGDGSGTARVSLFSRRLPLIKQARDPVTGAPLTDVFAGQTVAFVLFVDNDTDGPALDITLIDSLNSAEFTYVLDSLETVELASGTSLDSAWSGVWTSQTDALGAPDDLAAYQSGTRRITVGAVPGYPSRQLDIPAGRLRAVRFRVTVN